MSHDFQADIDAINSIGAIPTILDVVCRTTGMRFAAVARVTDDRWIACSVLDKIQFGLVPGGELKVATTICQEVRDQGHHVVIDSVTDDEAYCGHPTPAMYGFESYISMPIVLRDGRFFGTLCAIDPQPARLNNPETIGMFKLFAELIAFHLDAADRVASAQAAVRHEEQMAVLREQFIAIIGHDLRNPVASIDAGIGMLKRSLLSEAALRIVDLMQASTSRVKGLIDNLTDFAQGRMGGGLTVNIEPAAPLEQVLAQVIAEARAIHPGRAINISLDLVAPVACDPARIAQLFSNLLGNALTHGAPADPIRVSALTAEGTFELSVANTGAPIAEDDLRALFLPFWRGKDPSGPKGLGLGLYIAAEIARAHRGTITADSTPTEIRFTLRIPC